MLFTFDQVASLNQDLKAFGLNPSDWNVLREKSSIYRIESKEDRRFIFKGKAQRRGSALRWERLELVSI
ncbi:MAG: hypothetical protein ACAH59_11305 [Pseudobdellovibrionaceae bacterium]